MALSTLAACDQDSSKTAITMNGAWAWSTTMNCYGSENIITFHGPQIQVFLHGELVITVPDARIQYGRLSDKPLIIITYRLQGHRFEERYVALNAQRLKLISSKIDGQNKGYASGASTKQLIRCPSESQTL